MWTLVLESGSLWSRMLCQQRQSRTMFPGVVQFLSSTLLALSLVVINVLALSPGVLLCAGSVTRCHQCTICWAVPVTLSTPPSQPALSDPMAEPLLNLSSIRPPTHTCQITRLLLSYTSICELSLKPVRSRPPATLYTQLVAPPTLWLHWPLSV